MFSVHWFTHFYLGFCDHNLNLALLWNHFLAFLTNRFQDPSGKEHRCNMTQVSIFKAGLVICLEIFDIWRNCYLSQIMILLFLVFTISFYIFTNSSCNVNSHNLISALHPGKYFSETFRRSHKGTVLHQKYIETQGW